MSTDLPVWTDLAGVTHSLRPASELTRAERNQLDILRQQVRYTAHLLDSGFNPPTIAQAPSNMMRRMLRILLPSVAEQEIETFDSTEAHALLTKWWAISDAGG
jgi:hypothetical protein